MMPAQQLAFGPMLDNELLDDAEKKGVIEEEAQLITEKEKPSYSSCQLCPMLLTTLWKSLKMRLATFRPMLCLLLISASGD